MAEKILLDNLTSDSVSVLKIAVTVIEEQEVEVSRWRRAYENSVMGRAKVEAEIAEPYKSAIMTAWGDSPTKEE